MASGQFTVVTSNANVDGKVTWSSTPNTSGNYSDVYVEMRLWRSNTGYTTYGTGNFTVNVNGTPVSVSNKSFTLTYNSNTLILSGTVRVTHNSDGKKSITISWSGSSDVFSVTSGSGTAVLDTIPRASSITSSANWTAGSNLTVSISRADADFVHSIYVYVNGVLIKNVGNIATSYTFSWTTAENTSIFNQLNSAATEDTKILLITYEYNGGSEVGRVEKTGTVTAPAASTVTSGTDLDRYIDEDFIVGISRANSGFTHTVEIKFGTLTFSRTGVTTSVTFTWTQAEKNQLYAQIPNANKGIGSVVITTYYNGEKVRSSTSATMYLNVRNSNPIFSTFTYTDTNATMNTLKGVGNEMVMIQNKSTLVATITNANKAVAQNGSSISKYVLTLEGATITDDTPFSTDITFTYGVIQASTNQTISIKAYDSRGNYTEVKYTVTVVPWSAPVVNTSATRTNGFENATTLTLSGSISPVSVASVNKNSLKAANTTYRWRQKGTSTWTTAVAFSGLTLTMPNYSATNAAVNSDTGLDNNYAWEIEVTVTDQLGYTTKTLTVSAGQPVMMWDDVKKAVGINKFPTSGMALDVNGSVYFGGSTTAIATTDFTGSVYVRHRRGTDGFITAGSGSVDYGQLIVNSNNQAIQIGLDNTTNSRKGYIQVGHNSSGFASSYGELHLNPLGGNIIMGAHLYMNNNAPIYQKDSTGTARRSIVRGTDNDLHLNPDPIGATAVWGNGGALKVIGTDHTYIELYPQGIANGRKTYIGYSSANSPNLEIQSSGEINIRAEGAVARFLKLGSTHDGIQMAGQAILKWLSSGTTIQVRTNTDGAYATLQAIISDQTSDRRSKKNIFTITTPFIDGVKAAPVYKYNLWDDDQERDFIGIMTDEAPPEIVIPNISDGYDGIQMYSMISWLWGAVRELEQRTAHLDKVKMDKPA